MKQTALAFAFVVASTTAAHAGGLEGSIGLGAEYGVVGGGVLGIPGGVGIGGLSLNYDGGAFHTGGFLALYDGGGDDDTAFSIGGRFYYHLHSGSMSDFGVGGTLGIVSADVGMARDTFMVLDGGFQIRAFVASNVALSFSGGLSIGALEADGIFLSGQLTGSAGVHYYFF